MNSSVERQMLRVIFASLYFVAAIYYLMLDLAFIINLVFKNYLRIFKNKILNK